MLIESAKLSSKNISPNIRFTVCIYLSKLIWSHLQKTYNKSYQTKLHQCFFVRKSKVKIKYWHSEVFCSQWLFGKHMLTLKTGQRQVSCGKGHSYHVCAKYYIQHSHFVSWTVMPWNENIKPLWSEVYFSNNQHWVPPSQGQVCGLCGNYDGNSKNDFTTRSQETVADVLEFGNSWRVSSTCPNAQLIADPCASNRYRAAWSQKQCSIITSATFQSCHSQVTMVKANILTWLHKCTHKKCQFNCNGIPYKNVKCTICVVKCENHNITFELKLNIVRHFHVN